MCTINQSNELVDTTNIITMDNTSPDIKYAIEIFCNRDLKINFDKDINPTLDELYSNGIGVIIPMRSIELAKDTDIVLKEFLEDIDNSFGFADYVECCINKDFELEFSQLQYSDYTFADYTNFLKVIAWAKRDMNEIFHKNGIIKADCTIRFQIYPLIGW